MPHIHLEYSDNLQPFDAKPVLSALNRALFSSGHVSSALDIKSRALCQQDCVIGLVPDSAQAYAHVKVSLLEGRSLQVQEQISALLLQALREQMPERPELRIQLCVEMLEITSSTYAKTVIV